MDWKAWPERQYHLEGPAGSGDLIIEVSKNRLFAAFQNAGKYPNIGSSTSKYEPKNRRVIRCKDLTDTPEEELLYMWAQGITEVRKIRLQRDGRRINTDTIILPFWNPVLPTSIKIAFLWKKVDAYISNPLRCFKCQGTDTTEWPVNESLPAPNEGKECNQRPHCVNCDGDHGSFSWYCPEWTSILSM